MRIAVHCPAKLNLFLAVGKKDERGYHPVRTILQAISLFDELTISDEGKPGVHSDNFDLPPNNTLSKAERLLREFVSLPPLNIHLNKRIPSEAGLGGGSSDAAGLIRAIHHFAPHPLTPDQMHDVAAAIGVDTPFFLTGGRAIGTNYGEVITPLPDSDIDLATRYILIKPDIGISSGKAYMLLDALDYDFLDLPTPNPQNPTYNDFERIAPCECLDIIDRMRILGCKNAGLTGSGSAVFGVTTESDAPRIASDLMRYAHDPIVVRPLTRTSLKSEV